MISISDLPLSLIVFSQDDCFCIQIAIVLLSSLFTMLPYAFDLLFGRHAAGWVRWLVCAISGLFLVEISVSCFWLPRLLLSAQFLQFLGLLVT